VLMDLQMPEMDGFQATAHLRADRRFASLPIIAMTAHATIEERQRCLVAGMNDHVAKPIDPAVLFHTLGHYYRPPVESEATASRAAEPPPRNAEAAHDATLPSVKGLDTADGLMRVAGNRRLYLKLLRQFVDQQSQAPARIAAALTAGDHASAERIAHTVKGVAGNLGAGAVQASAADLEQAIARRGDADRLEAGRQRLAGELDALIGRLRPALGEDPALAGPLTSAAADPEALKVLVAQMRKQLSELDPGAADVLDDNRERFHSLLGGDEFSKFEQHVHGYAFGEAQALLERAATAHGL